MRNITFGGIANEILRDVIAMSALGVRAKINSHFGAQI